MNPRGHRELGALVVLLVVLTSGLAVLPQVAQAQGNQIVGLVEQCGSPTTFISGASVTLTDASGLKSPMTSTTGGDGTYAFTPGPGYYTIRVERTGYFDGGSTAPFRFDDTATEQQDVCLDPTPTADRTLSLLVVTAATTVRTNEVVNFPKTQITSENAAPTWNTAGNLVTLAQTPVSSQGVVVRYTNTGAGGSLNNVLFVNNTDYRWNDYWTGRIEVLNPTAISDLDLDPNRVSLLVSYSKWTPVSRLAFYPVDDVAAVTAKKNGAAWPSAGNWDLDRDTGIVTVLGNLINGTDVLTFDYSSVGALEGAAVDVFYAPRTEVVASGIADASGRVSFSLWSATFELRTVRVDFMPSVASVDTSAVSSLRIKLAGGIVVTGHARNPQGQFVSAGLQGWLYNTDPGANAANRAIRADVTGSLYTFHAPAGTYVMVIDANGWSANRTTRTFVATPGSPIDVVLSATDAEEFRTTILYGSADWNNLTIYRNLTLNPDSAFAGLEPAGLPDVRLQVDNTLGSTLDGTVTAGEADAFRAWVEGNGPIYVTTDGVLTTNGESYRSAVAYSVTVEGLTTAGSKVWVNTSTTYALKDAPPYVAAGADRYFVNLTALPDVNVSVLQDQVYVVALPRAYEMVSSTVFGPITTDGFTRVTVDPGESGTSPQIRMTIEKSDSGSARAKVAGPAGRFFVVNASFDNYRAFISDRRDIEFSAEDSIDPIGDIQDANFTWKFLANTTGANDSANIRYGIRPTFNYTTAGEFVVNLTVVEAGGNVTYRDITVWVDDQVPTARMRTNKTGGAPVANGSTLRVNEDQLVRFDGTPSLDNAYINATYGGGNRTGRILDNGYVWDFDGDGITDATSRIVNRSIEKPGTYNVNLTVTDSVGHKSTNTTLIVVANDTTVPTPAFDILDRASDWDIITTGLVEGREYSLNASRTTDNYNKASELNYTWTIPGPIRIGGVDQTGTSRKLYGINVTFTWTEFNNSYRVILNVTDTGFGSGKTNVGTLTRDIPVGIDTAVRPDLSIVQNTLKLSNSNPEDGATITVTVNVTNAANRGPASALKKDLYLVTAGQATLVTSTASVWNRDGTERTNGTIGPGETVTIRWDPVVTGQGNKTLRVQVCDTEEAYTQCGPGNQASASISIRQSTLQQLAFYGSIVGVLALFVFYMVYRRKVRAGDWQPVRLRRGEKGEGEERKPRKEVKEEKKRL
jgi:PKD repeat protein